MVLENWLVQGSVSLLLYDRQMTTGTIHSLPQNPVDILVRCCAFEVLVQANCHDLIPLQVSRFHEYCTGERHSKRHTLILLQVGNKTETKHGLYLHYRSDMDDRSTAAFAHA